MLQKEQARNCWVVQSTRWIHFWCHLSSFVINHYHVDSNVIFDDGNDVTSCTETNTWGVVTRAPFALTISRTARSSSSSLLRIRDEPPRGLFPKVTVDPRQLWVDDDPEWRCETCFLTNARLLDRLGRPRAKKEHVSPHITARHLPVGHSDRKKTYTHKYSQLLGAPICAIAIRCKKTRFCTEWAKCHTCSCNFPFPRRSTHVVPIYRSSEAFPSLVPDWKQFVD